MKPSAKQGPPPQTSMRLPSKLQEGRLLLARERRAARTAVGVVALVRRGVRERRRRGAPLLVAHEPDRPRVPDHHSRAAERTRRQRRHAEVGLHVEVASRVGDRAVDARADRASLHLDGHVGHLVVAERGMQQHLMRWGVRVRIAGHVVRVSVRLGAIPVELHQREDQRPLELVRVVLVEPGSRLDALEVAVRVGVEVHRAPQQRRVVHAGHAEHRALVVDGERRERAAHDPALAVAVVEEAALLVLPRHLEVRMGAQAAGVDHPAAQVELIHEALLGPVGQRREAREVLEDRDHVRRVVDRHAGPVGCAEREAVLVAHRLHVSGGYLAGAAEQAVAVERQAQVRAAGERGPRDRADDVGAHRRCRAGGSAARRRRGSIREPGGQSGVSR